MRRNRGKLVLFCIGILCAAPLDAEEPGAPVCGPAAAPNQEIYRILWSSPEGGRQRLWVSRFPKYAVMVFRSESAADRDWARDLAVVESVDFRKSAPGSGMLSIRFKEPDDAVELGPIPTSCWDGLQQHLGHHAVIKDGND